MTTQEEVQSLHKAGAAASVWQASVRDWVFSTSVQYSLISLTDGSQLLHWYEALDRSG